MSTTRLRVTLLDVVPEAHRVVDVPATLTLDELHPLLQAAMGWTDSHLHQYVVDGQPYGPPDDEGMIEQGDEAGVRLRDLSGSFRYLYDFGDGWEHEVTVLGPGQEPPGCREGAGACPPEDCGGVSGYEHLLEVLDDPAHPEHEHLLAWAGGRPTWDLAATDQLVRDIAGEVPASVRLVLDQLGAGVTLTPGGRLPRVVVRAVQEQRPEWYPLRRPASVEEDLFPLLHLRELLRRAGLLRLAAGVLRPTRAASDDREVLRRLRKALSPGTFEGLVITLVPARLVVHGPQSVQALAEVLLPEFAGWGLSGHPLTQDDLRSGIYGATGLLRALDLVDGEQIWQAGPSAGRLLPDTALAVLAWRRHGG